MTEHSSLPSRLRPVAMALVQCVHDGKSEPSDLAELTEWLLVDGWESFLKISPELMVVDYKYVVPGFSDADYRDFHPQAPRRIKDEQRVTFARERLQYELENGDGSNNPSVMSYPIRDCSGREAVAVYVVPIQGQLGPDLRWLGAWRSYEEMIEALPSCGLLTAVAVDELPGNKILADWAKPKRRRL